jgi:Baseplate J-like protein
MTAAPPPALDLRSDERILEQLRELASKYVPEWKGDQDGRQDAGIMLQRIFTRLLEITLQRLNEAPAKNFDAFLNAVGISLLPPVPAQVPLTFSLTSGSGPILVPERTRAGTAQMGEQPAVDFETTADLTVVPSSLIAIRTVDPGWDRSADHFALINGSGGTAFAPLLGTRRLAHALFIGDERLLDFTRAEVTVTFDIPNSPEPANQFGKTVWQYVSDGEVVTAPVNATQNRISVNVSKRIDQRILKGPSSSSSLRRGLANRWLQAVLARPLSEDHGPERLSLKNVRVSVAVKNIQPDFAFANAVPLDVSMPFHPFGEEPKKGDAFYLACSEVFAKPNASLTLDFDCTATPHRPTLQWEFLGAAGWTEFDSVLDPTAALSEKGKVVVKSANLTLGSVNGEEGLWIRLRIHSGDYGKAAEYVQVDPDDPSKGFKLKEGTDNLAPPLVTKLRLNYEAGGLPDFLVAQNGFLLTDQTVANESGFKPFVPVQSLRPSIYADLAPSFYLGFDQVFPEQPMTLYFVVASRGPDAELDLARRESRSTQHSLRWEYFNGVTWVELSVLDRTSQFSESGTVDVLMPADIARLTKFDLEEIYWIRAVLLQGSENGGGGFRSDPLLTPRLEAIFINTVPAVQAVTIANEILGSANGLPGQTFRLTQNPVLANPEIFVLEPELPSAAERNEMKREQGSDPIEQRPNAVTNQVEIWIRWREVPDFNGSYPHSRHYTLDHGTGEVVFGNGILGLVPPLGSDNIVATYKVGGGSAGNVAKGAVVQLRSPVPGIASVTNPRRAEGGAGLETAEIARQRGPQTLRHRGRALSRSDFEWLAREAAGTRVARVVCLPNTSRAFRSEPGWVTLVIVPQGTERKLVPSVELIQQVENWFRNRCFAGLSALNRVHVTGPDYIEVAVAVDAVVRDIRQASQIKGQIAKALDRFLHPLTGGPNGDGWKLGRNVFASEIASVVHTVPEVDYLKSLQLIPSQVQHRIDFASPFTCQDDLHENTPIILKDRRKSALVAESVAAGTEVRFLPVKGFKVGNRIVQVLDDANIFNPPLTITAITPKPESGMQVIGIESWEHHPPAAGTLLSSPDQRVKLPVAAVGLESSLPPPLRFLTLEDFRRDEVVQIQLTKEGSQMPVLEIERVSPATDVYVGGISLVCPGQHRITVSRLSTP